MVPGGRDCAVEDYLSNGSTRKEEEEETEEEATKVGGRGLFSATEDNGLGAVVLREVRRIGGSLLTVTIRRSRGYSSDPVAAVAGSGLQVEAFDHAHCAVHAIVCFGAPNAPRNNPPRHSAKVGLTRRIAHILGMSQLNDDVVERCVNHLAMETLRQRRNLSHVAACGGQNRVTTSERAIIRKMARMIAGRARSKDAVAMDDDKLAACARALRSAAYAEIQEVRSIAASVAKFGVARACTSVLQIEEVRMRSNAQRSRLPFLVLFSLLLSF